MNTANLELTRDERSVLTAIAGTDLEQRLRTEALQRKAKQRREIRARAAVELAPAETALAGASATRATAERDHQRNLERAASSLAVLRAASRAEIGAEAHRDSIIARQRRELASIADQRAVELGVFLNALRRVALQSSAIEISRRSTWTLRGPVVEIETTADLALAISKEIGRLAEEVEQLALFADLDDPGSEVERIHQAALSAIQPLIRHRAIQAHDLPKWESA